MLVTLGEKQCDSSRGVLAFITLLPHEHNEKDARAGRELKGSYSATISCLTTNLKLKHQSHRYQERQAVTSEIDMIRRYEDNWR